MLSFRLMPWIIILSRAIANSVDSDDQNSNEFAPFLNIMNECYLRDLSRKQKTAIRVKGESGDVYKRQIECPLSAMWLITGINFTYAVR